MLESYLSPYLLSYVNKYIKNIKPEDLQVSLWGGDLVLTQLDLRLDVLEKELYLPLSFVSGHIHELKIHIPWTALGSEPAVVTINTIEFVVKLKDGASSDGKSESTVSSKGDGEDQVVPTSQTKKHRSGAGSEFTPGYIQSLTRRVINNAHIIINNLILKYVEEDIVLSVNVKSVESYATDAVWERAFVDLSLPELVLRRLCTFSDITVCLDKRNASGKIEVYQEPVIYHWNLTTRIHMTFKNLAAKAASVIKLSTFCDELNLSLSETQLPMYIRLVQLVLALYYGTLDLPEAGTGNSEKESEETSDRKDAAAALTSLVEQTESEDGWGSWAWSMVPQVFTYDDEEEEEQQRRKKSQEDPIIAVGFYCRQGSVTFKLSNITNTGGPFSSSRKLNVQPFLQLSGSGMSLEILMEGLAFFNVEMGFSHIAVQGLANCTCGVDDFNITLDDTRDFLPFIECGDVDLSNKETNYLTGSLFDPVCPENLQNQVEYILDQEKHHELFTEDYGKARFGAFWTDYVFTMTPILETEGSDSGSVGSDTLSEPIFTWKELSWKKFVLFPCKVTISSSLVHRLQQLQFSAQNHEYEPYSREKPEVVDENRPVPTREQVTALEEHVPSRSTQFSVLGLDVQFLLAEHPHFTAGPSTLSEISNKEPPMSLSLSLLPSLHIQLQRLDLQTTVPMYARRLVKAVSKLSRPSGDLLHHCYSHLQLKVFGLEAAFSLVPVGDVTSSSSEIDQKILEPASVAAYQKTLALGVYWKDTFQVKKEIQMELPKINVKLTKAQTLLASHLYHSWASPSYESDWLKQSSLITDAFPEKDNKAVTLEGSVSNIDLRFTSNQIVWAIAGTVEQAQVVVADYSKGTMSPIMQGPAETDLSSKEKKKRQDEDVKIITFTVQMKRDTEGVDNSDGLSVVFLDVQGFAFCLDPSLLPWLIYQPKQKSTDMDQSPQSSFHSQTPQDSFQEIPGKSSSQKKVGPFDQRMLSQTELQSLTEDGKETAGSRGKEHLYFLAQVLQDVIVQVNIQPAIFIIPAEPMTFDQSQQIIDFLIKSDDPGMSLPPLLVISAPSLSVMSSGHIKLDLDQEIPLHRLAVPQEPGPKFPWTVKANSFHIFSIGQNSEPRFHLLEPLAIASTVAFNSHIEAESKVRSVGIVVHTDMPGVQINCSHEQVTLLKSLTSHMTTHLPELMTAFSIGPPRAGKRSPISRSMSNSGNIRTTTLSSRTSSEHLRDTTISLSSPVESVSRDETEEEEEVIDPSSVRVSFWIQWTLDKVGACLITRKSNETGRRAKLCAVMEDLTTSVDYQDVFSKVTCKVGSLNVKHFLESEAESWKVGPFSGILFTSSDIFTKSLDSPVVTPRSPGAPKMRTLHHKAEPKFVDPKQSHSFFSLIWTRAKGASIGKRMEGKERPLDMSRKQKNFVNEIIVSMLPIDTVIWCPVMAEMICTIISSEEDSSCAQKSKSLDSTNDRPFYPVPPSPSPLKSPPQAVPRKPKLDAPSRSKGPTSSVSSFDKWFTSSIIPLLYFDLQEMRCFLPVKDYQEKEENTKADLFLFKLSHVKLVPYADNPLPRMVMKKEMFRKAQLSRSSQKLGAPMEDRQYQLDVTNLGLLTASWKEIQTVTEEEKRKVDPEIIASQNPALEWNTSPPKQGESVVHMMPVIEEFSICCTVAPAITVMKTNSDKTLSKPVIVCGHSMEANIASDVALYLSLSNITLAQSLLSKNFGALSKCLPTPSKPSAVLHPMPAKTKHKHSRADSGFDSDFSHRSQDHLSEFGQKMSVASDRSTSGGKVMKQKYKATSVKLPAKATKKARKIIPFDVLLTGREISLILFSQEEDSGICPFLLTEFSQPSFVASVSKQKQKVELSLYNMKMHGASPSQNVTDSDLPTASNFPVPWFETCLGEPNTKTGVRPALFTMSATDFLSGEGAFTIDLGRPMKVSISLDKGEQVLNFVQKLKSKFQRKRQVWPPAEELVSSSNPFASGLNVPIPDDKISPDLAEEKKRVADSLTFMTLVKNVTISTSRCVVTVATGCHDEFALASFSISGSHGNIKVYHTSEGLFDEVDFKLHISGVTMETGLGHSMRPLVGPVNVDVVTVVHLMDKGPNWNTFKTVSQVTCGHIPVFFGQEHLNCLTKLLDDWLSFLTMETTKKKEKIKSTTTAVEKSHGTADPTHSQDDLRSGNFAYITDSDVGHPLPNQIQFHPGGEGANHDGSMTWRYPEPRVLTRITLTPVPLRTASNDGEDDDQIDVPCRLEYWDEMAGCFQSYKELFVSETNTYHVSMGLSQRPVWSEGAVTASIWRMLLNPQSDESFNSLLADKNMILTPMALAASLRVDSCFSPLFVPVISLALKIGLVEIHLENHLSQLGQAMPEMLQPFTFDGTEPNNQEFCLISSNDIIVTSQLWKTPDPAIKVKMNTAVKASLVNYSHLTMVPLIGNMPIEGSITVDKTDGGCLAEVSVENLYVRVGQGSLHTLTNALQCWMNNKMPASDRVVSAYYILCNNTNVSLRLGQIATDESLVLEPRQMHSYSWRTHKQQKQFLHVCIEGWKNFHWSDPFGIDQNCIIVRRLEHKEQEATLFIQVKEISPLQKQIIFHAKQSFVNHLTIPLEIHIQHSDAKKDSDPKKEANNEFTSQQLMPLEANSSLPSLVVEDKEIIGVKIKVKGQECDWSQQFAIAGEMKREKFIVEIPLSNNSSVSFCCTILEEMHDGHVRRAILFSPSFWVHNSLPHSLIVNLTCRKTPEVQSEEVKGYGTMTPLYHISPSSPYFATFQLNSDTSPSSPAIPISLDSDVFVVVPKEPVHITDLLFQTSAASSKDKWPFEETDPSPPNANTSPAVSVNYPATDLNIHLSHDWSHVDSVVINVEPWCLVSNETEWYITIQDGDDVKSFIPAGAVIAPPKIQDKFVLSVSHKERQGCSQVVSLENEKISPFMRPDQMEGKQLFIDGYVSLEIPFTSEGTKCSEVCYVVVQSELKENIRVLTIRPRFIVQNDTENEIALKTIEIAPKEKVPPNILRAIQKLILAPKTITSSIIWRRFESKSHDQKNPVWKKNMSVTVIETTSTGSSQATNERNWSKWIQVDSQNPRQPIPVPLESSGNMKFATTPFVAALHEEKGLTYVCLGVDPSPRMVVTNQCSFPLQVGQAVPSKLFQGGMKVIEDTLELPDSCIIPPQRMSHYSVYTLSEVTAQVQICLAVAPFFSAVQLPERNEDQVKSEPEWSEAIKIASDSTPVAEIIALSTGCYVLVSSHMTGCQTNVNVELLSMESPTKGKSGTVQAERGLSEKTKFDIFQKLNVRMLVKNITMSLMDEVNSSFEFVEVLRVQANMGQFMTFPVPSSDSNLLVQCFHFAVNTVQVDNQDYRSGRYDFPVIFKGSEGLSQREDRIVSNFADIAETNKNECFIAVEMTVEVKEGGKVAGLKDLTIHFSDGEVFIEDQFIFDMLHYCRTFPKVALTHSKTPTSREVLPGKVKASLAALKGPISLQHLTIKPITVLASVHASMKIFVAVDRTVLNFGQFDTGPVFTTASQLGQALSVHYTSGAIFKAGWVLGSLEILGNPAGLLRSVGSGLADTILLPYEGLTRGPTAFISGVAGGISSLVWQVTAGTLTSITKFATSVSRNLDRLSLDSDHMIRQETARRRVPSRTTEGLVQGLSHFGISILGAIAGIADQPIRGFQRAGSTGESHASDHAREVISGFGKGLVGAVVKPIGGAAELVSQTGQGILHGTGLAEVPKQLTAQQIELRAKFPNSRTKYTWKMLSTLSKPDLLMQVKVTSVTHHGLHHAGALLLTPEVLFVISLSEDTHQQSFPLDQTQCVPVRGSEEGLKFVVKGATTPLASPEVPETSDLIADFVDVSSSFVGSLEDLQCPSNEESSEASVNFDPATFTFFMNRYHRQTFVSLFELSKKRTSGEDFYSQSDQDIASTRL